MTRAHAAGAIAISIGCVPVAGGCELVLGLDRLQEQGAGDAGAPDSTTGDEPATGDGPASADGRTSPCLVPDAHTLCEDFDEIDAVSQLVGAWNVSTGAGSLTLADSPVLSSPHSLAIQIDPLQNSSPSPVLSQSFQQGATSVTCQMGLWIDHGDPLAAQSFAVIELQSDAGPVSAGDVELQFDDARQLDIWNLAYLADGGLDKSSTALGSAVPDGGWAQVSFTVFRTGTASATVTFGDAAPMIFSVNVVVPAAPTAVLVSLGRAGTLSTGSTGLLCHVDNYYCDITP